MTEPAPILTRAFQCACWIHRPTTTQAPTLIDSIDIETATQAIRWIRVAVRTITSALEPDAREQAWDWLSADYRNALHALTSGQPCTLTLHDSGTTIQWTAHPTTYLKLATRQGLNLPACAEQYMQPQQQRE
ncbi:hypothetical protein AB0O07_31055 [Streptomyces sp. NPDC093085]|uniref:hypothetical protein n=1 Tax=Streptomyces sp. NPDC093085 TaxID=3155068 RepID=UPI00342E93F0